MIIPGNIFFKGLHCPFFYSGSRRKSLKCLFLFITTVFFSCNENEPIPTADLRPTSLTDSIQLHIASLKKNCLPGDLIVRLGDDFISDRIRYLSVTDHSYSHAGIIVTHQNKKMVCHIYPDDFNTGADTVRYEAIDSFINIRTNLKCALYRYDLSDNEKINLQIKLAKYHDMKVHFDKIYELETDSKLYCSEMIYKALKKITNKRIIINESFVPKNMQHLLLVFFKKYNPQESMLEKRRFIAIDNLYNNPHCRLIMKFTLKAMP